MRPVTKFIDMKVSDDWIHGTIDCDVFSYQLFEWSML